MEFGGGFARPAIAGLSGIVDVDDGSRDDHGRSSFINQNAVCFIDDQNVEWKIELAGLLSVRLQALPVSQ